MIGRIRGKLIERGEDLLLIDIGGICYEVLVPPTTMQRLDENLSPEGAVSLVTYHYLQVEPARNTPVLIGFLSEVEREFFEQFITVSGIGPRAALKALSQPISCIARAIDEGDITFLKSLPGIGDQRARLIIAKLQNKVGKFGLVRDGKFAVKEATAGGIEEEALAVLTQLQYKRGEAEGMIRKALERKKGISSTEELLNEVYRQRKQE
ncbi:MAG: Holliday junction ATP-dependent DNA helicase RuvA [Candidatus Omnitrophica bacterium]|nr:Holliday junction ATP-dependent DNA helicase RuvA [Candidatus Omnitrophota bacterium]MDD5655194.1 Holliday junction ATP-dependent DNA helicase RuvA [Candidatus Omnitrophota bacterium]